MMSFTKIWEYDTNLLFLNLLFYYVSYINLYYFKKLLIYQFTQAYKTMPNYLKKKVFMFIPIFSMFLPKLKPCTSECLTVRYKKC